MSSWADVHDAHRQDVDRLGSAVLDVLRRWRDGGMGAGKPDDVTLQDVAADAATVALLIVAEAEEETPKRIAQFVREEARRLGNKGDDALMREWSRICQADGDVILRTLARDVRDTAARIDVPLYDPSSPNSFADDLRATLRRVAAGDVHLDMPPGANAMPSRRGRPPDVGAASAAEFIVGLYVATTGQAPTITHGEPGRRSVHNFAAEVGPALGLDVPGRRVMDVATTAARRVL